MFKDLEGHRSASISFSRNGYYTSHLPDTSMWTEFWSLERDKCLYGTRDGDGVRVTGEMYFYLNFFKILQLSSDKRKVMDFPRFLDYDYEYFWLRYISRHGMDDVSYRALGLLNEVSDISGGKNLCVLKARRKGYSWKAASVCCYNLAFRPDTTTLIIAYSDTYLKSLMQKVYMGIHFLNTSTPFKIYTDTKGTQTHIVNAYKVKVDGAERKEGLMSQVVGIVSGDNTDAGKGFDVYEAFVEEAGVFGAPGTLIKVMENVDAGCMAGAVRTGMITIFGTIGLTDKNQGSRDLLTVFENPEAYNMLSVEDIHTPRKDLLTGFFVGAQHAMEGYYDSCGNSDIVGALSFVKNRLNVKVKSGADQKTIREYINNFPTCPKDVGEGSEGNRFDVAAIRGRRDHVLSKKLNDRCGEYDIYYRGGQVIVRPNLGKQVAIRRLRDVADSREGGLVVFEHPLDGAPEGLYLCGYDPVRQDTGSSLACVVVFKRAKYGDPFSDTIVAEWVGRRAMNAQNHLMCEMIAEYYGAKIMFENEVPDVLTHFRQRGKLEMLLTRPENVISKHIAVTKTLRQYGCHMTSALKLAGIEYLNNWAMAVHDYKVMSTEEGQRSVMNIENVLSLRLLDEMIEYNNRGNFDYISCMIMVMLQVNNERQAKVFGAEAEKTRMDEYVYIVNESYGDNDVGGVYYDAS